jgi:hypothetical protein
LYTTPANVNSGGTWQLVAKSSGDTQGIAAVSANIANIATAQNEGPRGTVNGGDPAGFGVFSNTVLNPGRLIVIGQAPLASLGAGEEQSVFYGVGTLANGAPNYPGKPAGTNSIGPLFTSLTSVQDVPWGLDDSLGNPAWNGAALLASGTFAPGLTPDFFAGSTGSVFTTVGTSNSYGNISDPVALTTVVRTNFTSAGDADYNDNGVVDAADYVLWRNTLGQTGAGLPADGDGSGTIDQPDYTLWRSRFGLPGGAGAGAGAGLSGSVVPEPASLFLLAVAVMFLIALHRAQRQMQARQLVPTTTIRRGGLCVVAQAPQPFRGATLSDPDTLIRAPY